MFVRDGSRKRPVCGRGVRAASCVVRGPWHRTTKGPRWQEGARQREGSVSGSVRRVAGRHRGGAGTGRKGPTAPAPLRPQGGSRARAGAGGAGGGGSAQDPGWGRAGRAERWQHPCPRALDPAGAVCYSSWGGPSTSEGPRPPRPAPWPRGDACKGPEGQRSRLRWVVTPPALHCGSGARAATPKCEFHPIFTCEASSS